MPKAFTIFILLLFTVLQGTAQDMKTIKAAENIYLVGDRTFSCFYVTDSGVVVIDPIDSAHANATLKAIRKVTDQPVRYLFYSHNHWDHIRGGKFFKAEGASIISHAEAAKNIPPHPEVLLPDTSWQGDKVTFSLGKQQLELYYYGRNHGNGMTVFRFPEHNSIFIIDLVVPDRVLYAYLPDASPKEWVEDLEAIQQLEFDDVYMSHVRAIGNRNDVDLMQRYFKDLYAAVDEKLKDGTPFFDIPQAVKLPQYSHLKNYDKWLPLNAWRILMEKSIGQ